MKMRRWQFGVPAMLAIAACNSILGNNVFPSLSSGSDAGADSASLPSVDGGVQDAAIDAPGLKDGAVADAALTDSAVEDAGRDAASRDASADGGGADASHDAPGDAARDAVTGGDSATVCLFDNDASVFDGTCVFGF